MGNNTKEENKQSYSSHMYLRIGAMIPHHSMAILRSERANIVDLRVCELAVEISEAQGREILEMEWLIEDIRQNGLATTPTTELLVP